MEPEELVLLLETIPKELAKNGQRFYLTISFYPHPVFSYTAENGETYGVIRGETFTQALQQTVIYLTGIGAYVKPNEPRHIGETEREIEALRRKK